MQNKSNQSIRRKYQRDEIQESMKNHIDTKRKAEIIQQAYKLRAKGISIEEICLTYNLEIKSMQTWLRNYRSYLRGEPMREKSITRCIPYFQSGTLEVFEKHEKKPKKVLHYQKKKENKRKKITILWGLITIN